MKYGITAATGHFGQVAVKKLVGLVGADNVVAIARNLEKAKQLLPDDIEVRQGDYDDKNSLVSAFEGLDTYKCSRCFERSKSKIYGIYKFPTCWSS